MAETLRDAELKISEGGHCPWLNDAERIAGWVDSFLGRTTRTSSAAGARV
jgi:hypothetical protein